MNTEELIAAAYREDIPKGDVTTDPLQSRSLIGRARLIAKEDLVLSGCEVFEKCIQHISKETEIKWHMSSSDVALAGQTVATLRGPHLDILKAERVALNFMGRLSGIATLTQCFVKNIEHTKCKILDTRKTTPLLRALERKAVKDGGGENHRLNLSDAVLIKENHIATVGDFKQCIETVRNANGMPIEVETTNLDEVTLAVECKVECILLDNMNNETLKAALDIIPDTIKTEASGNMTLDRVGSVAELGVDFISVGALTHSAPTADLSLVFDTHQADSE